MATTSERFTQIDSALALANLEILPSEIHGIVVGAIANHLKTGVSPDLLKLVEPEANPEVGRFAPVHELLYELYRDQSELLFENKEGFDLILPDDDQPITEQVSGIAAWCKGYLLGLLYNNRFSIDQLPESGAEIARDFLEISEAAAGDGDDEEESWALAELQEYVKVGAQLVFEFIYAERSDQPPAASQ